MNDLLREHGVEPATATSDDLLNVVSLALARHVANPGDRDAARELLAIDGIITRAFATAGDPSELETRARGALHRLLALDERA